MIQLEEYVRRAPLRKPDPKALQDFRERDPQLPELFADLWSRMDGDADISRGWCLQNVRFSSIKSMLEVKSALYDDPQYFGLPSEFSRFVPFASTSTKTDIGFFAGGSNLSDGVVEYDAQAGAYYEITSSLTGFLTCIMQVGLNRKSWESKPPSDRRLTAYEESQVSQFREFYMPVHYRDFIWQQL